MLMPNLLISSQKLIIPAGLLSHWSYGERWDGNRSCPRTLCIAGTKQKPPRESCFLCSPAPHCNALCTHPSIDNRKIPVMVNLPQLKGEVQRHQPKISSPVKVRGIRHYTPLSQWSSSGFTREQIGTKLCPLCPGLFLFAIYKRQLR